MPRNKPRVVVIGVGNLLLKDEGIGVHVVRALKEINIPQNINLKIIDGGTSPDLLAFLEGVDKLIIVDAVKTSGRPGTIYRLNPEGLTINDKKLISAHEFNLRQNLKMMILSGKKPKEVVLIGIEPKEIDWGMALSPELERKVPEITRVIFKEIGTFQH